MTARVHRAFTVSRQDEEVRVLIVEDELRMASLIRRGLLREGLAADVAGSGEEALVFAGAHEYDAVVLDVLLPGMNGFETCGRLRSEGVWTPVLMLTARDAVEDRVAGLDSGADDYLVKPFAFAELLARLRALVRRGEPERPSVLEVGDLSLDPATRRLRRRASEVAMAIVLAGTSWFVYAGLRSHLTTALDHDLRLRAEDLSALVRQRDESLAATTNPRFIEPGEAYAELLDSHGRVLDATRPLGGT